MERLHITKVSFFVDLEDWFVFEICLPNDKYIRDLSKIPAASFLHIPQVEWHRVKK